MAAPGADAILGIVQRASGEFNAVNVSTAFHRLAKTWRDEEPGCNREELAKALEALTELALQLVSQFQGQARHRLCHDKEVLKNS